MSTCGLMLIVVWGKGINKGISHINLHLCFWCNQHSFLFSNLCTGGCLSKLFDYNSFLAGVLGRLSLAFLVALHSVVLERKKFSVLVYFQLIPYFLELFWGLELALLAIICTLSVFLLFSFRILLSFFFILCISSLSFCLASTFFLALHTNSAL